MRPRFSPTQLSLETLEDRAVPAVIVPNSKVSILFPVFVQLPAKAIGLLSPKPAQAWLKGLVSIDPQPEPPRAITVQLSDTVFAKWSRDWLKVGPQPEPPTIVGVIPGNPVLSKVGAVPGDLFK